MSKIPFYLVTGFLGSGKTTLLKRIINEYSDSKRIAVIQNEFTSGKVDGFELKQLNKKFEILEINKGSVFCVCLLSSFIESLSQFINEHKPDIVVLEASGLSDPIAIAEVLQQKDLSSRLFLRTIWCIIDSPNYLKANECIGAVKNQIRVADKIILNKTDLFKGDLSLIRDNLNEINPIADVIEAEYCDFNFKDELENSKPILNHKNDKDSIGTKRPDISSGVIKTSAKVDRSGLEKFLNEITPKMIRLKGFVRLNDNKYAIIQSSFGDYKIEEAKFFTGPSEIIFIGESVNLREINNRFKELVVA